MMAGINVHRIIEDWRQRAEQTYTEYQIILEQPAKRGIHVHGDGKAERLNDLQNRSNEIILEFATQIIPECERTLRATPAPSPSVYAAIEYLWTGRLFLLDPAGAYKIYDQLYGMVIYVTRLKNALAGVYNEPCRSIAALHLPYDTSAGLVLSNGVVTIGDLIDSIRRKVKFRYLNTEQLLSCYDALIAQQVTVLSDTSARLLF